MAHQARMDQEARKVEVNRLDLVKTLKENKAKHVAEYNDAVAGYKATLRQKVNDAFETAGAKLLGQKVKVMGRIDDLTDDQIHEQHSRVVVVEQIYVDMPVPQCYAKEYDAAIAIAEWDVRDTLELSYAEFTCFVRDEWDWSSHAKAVNATYSMARL